LLAAGAKHVHRYFVTGTDTDVGKTRVAAALARGLRNRGMMPTIVKLVQTGASDDDIGDARHAGELAGVPHREFVRFAKPADPWSAAVEAGVAPLRLDRLCKELENVAGPIVAEGSGGLMVPLGPREHLGDLAARAGLRAVIAVGLRLGCINHALLTHRLCERLGLAVAGAVLVERWGPTTAGYRTDVVRALQDSLPLIGILPFEPNEAAAVEAGAALFTSLANR
jgi:dethiobiotin synthetase